MNLLIVDDEYFSRENVKSSVSWQQYGINEIMEADDGVNALAVCEDYRPDIVLTEVRMPRMNGIEFAFKLREMFPDCAIIFMSGYSDKEYLKSAIKLKAISYIEKPIDEIEIKEAIEVAINQCKENISIKQQQVGSMHWASFQLALYLMNKGIDMERINSIAQQANIRLPSIGYFTTIVIRLYESDAFDPNEQSISSNIISCIEEAKQFTNMNIIWAIKDNYAIIHFYGPISEHSILMYGKVENFCKLISAKLSSEKIIFSIGIGKTVNKLTKIYISYDTAIKALNTSFFGKANSIYHYKEDMYYKSASLDENLINDFYYSLLENSNVQAISLIHKIDNFIRQNNVSEWQAKDFYSKILYQLFHVSKEKMLLLFDDFLDEYELYRYIQTINFLDDLSNFLLNRVILYFDLLDEKIDKNGPIDLVINYIAKHYDNPDLSLTLISEKIGIAPTYLCSIFKKYTGKTLNQYITEYRIKKAKELLNDKLLRVSNVSSMVGYRDGNYFTKIFKKYTNLSPSEYRKEI